MLLPQVAEVGAREDVDGPEDGRGTYGRRFGVVSRRSIFLDDAELAVYAGRSAGGMATPHAWNTLPTTRPIVGFQVFTLDHRLIRGDLGRLGDADAAVVTAALARLLGRQRASGAGNPTSLPE